LDELTAVPLDVAALERGYQRPERPGYTREARIEGRGAWWRLWRMVEAVAKQPPPTSTALQDLHQPPPGVGAWTATRRPAPARSVASCARRWTPRRGGGGGASGPRAATRTAGRTRGHAVG